MSTFSFSIADAVEINEKLIQKYTLILNKLNEILLKDIDFYKLFIRAASSTNLMETIKKSLLISISNNSLSETLIIFSIPFEIIFKFSILPNMQSPLLTDKLQFCPEIHLYQSYHKRQKTARICLVFSILLYYLYLQKTISAI